MSTYKPHKKKYIYHTKRSMNSDQPKKILTEIKFMNFNLIQDSCFILYSVVLVVMHRQACMMSFTYVGGANANVIIT